MSGSSAYPCASCPRVARGLAGPCLAELRNNRRLCQLAAMGDEAYIGLLVEDPVAAPPPQPTPTGVSPPVEAAPDPPAGGQPCCGGQPPGLLAKAANFARAAFEHVKAGSPEADEPTASARLAICLGCEHLDARAMTCNICGCSMPRKVYWLEQHCPIGKW
jgi:hypothetical protein